LEVFTTFRARTFETPSTTTGVTTSHMEDTLIAWEGKNPNRLKENGGKAALAAFSETWPVS
jgi:hypothetical protein